MPLEATMLIIDNSEYMRNGDYPPTRFEAQADAAAAVFRAKIDANPESTVGVMTMAGKGPEVLVTHTKDLGQLLAALHSARGHLGGTADVPTAVAVAQLALKHRENKNLRQRIVVLAGSPLEGDARALGRLAKKLKKNNVALDAVAFGDALDDGGALRALVEGATSGDNSHLLEVPPGPHLISDILLSSPVLSADRNIPDAALGDDAPAAAAPGAQFEFGVDPSLDPELAMALRMSMQEAQAREAAQAATSAPEPSAAPAPAAAASTPAPPAAASAPKETVPATGDSEDDALLQQALALSRGDGDVEMGADEDEDEDAAIARAIEMSMREEQDKGAGK